MNKPILSIETSDKICGACLYLSNDTFFSAKIEEKHSHSEMLFKVINEVLQSSRLNKADIGTIAVSAGPGSFTGLRIGMSAAKGMSHGLSVPVIPVPTFEALALQLSTIYKDQEIIIANKINRDEVYFARFYLKLNSYIFTDNLKILHNPAVESIKDDLIKFGNFFDASGISSPEPEFIAKWASEFGESIDPENIDKLEPLYLKNFIVKERKNAK